MLPSASADAQTRQYTPPGGARDDRERRREEIANAVEEARWSAGPLRLDPAFWVSDLSWIDDSTGGGESDLSARAGAGLRAYLPVGSRTTLAAFALPEYVWWQERDDESRLNQRFGIGSFTYFNRLQIELAALRDEEFGFATGESYQRVTLRTDRLEANLEIPLLRRFTLHASGSQSSSESLADDSALDELFVDLNREDRSVRGGLRYYPTEKLRFGAGVGRSETEFAEEAVDRSNSGDSWYVELAYERAKLGVSLDYQRHDLAGEPGSSFGSFDGDTSSGRVSWRPRESFELRVYGTRSLAYSLLTSTQTAYLDERVGIGANVELGWRLALDLYVETGEQSYEAELGGSDLAADVEGYGATLSVHLGNKFDLRVGYRRGEIGALPGVPERELEEIRGSLDFGIGGGRASWF